MRLERPGSPPNDRVVASRTCRASRASLGATPRPVAVAHSDFGRARDAFLVVTDGRLGSAPIVALSTNIFATM